MGETVSACLIVLNEAERLPAALDSVAFCDEVVVVDSGSTDGTVEQARQAGARVIESEWRGYGAQRNLAIEHATADWVLEIDADERVTETLRGEIQAFLADPPSGVDIAAIPIRHRFLGRELTTSAKYPGYRYRLFRRDAYRHNETRTVHEGLWANGPAFRMEGDLLHALADSLGEAIADTARYARLEAEQVAIARTPMAALAALVLRPAVKVAFRTVVHAGWRDGWRGLLKIGLDAGSDALVAVHALRRGQPSRRVPAVPHRPVERRGSVRVIGVAARANAADAGAWLARAHGLGADVSLVTDSDSQVHGVPVHRVPRFATMHVIRAVDAENQLRPCDAILTAGGAAGRVARVLPRALRGCIDPIPIAVDPRAALEVIERAARGRDGEHDSCAHE